MAVQQPEWAGREGKSTGHKIALAPLKKEHGLIETRGQILYLTNYKNLVNNLSAV